MGVTVDQFRKDFPEFGDIDAYTPSSIFFWIKIAQGDSAVTPPLNGMLNATRWRSQYNLASELFVAHNIVLGKLATNAGRVGGVPGLATGSIASKSVDKVAVSYDVQASIDPNAGHWNLTVYGQRLWQLIQMFGMGPMQFSGCGVGSFGGFFLPTSYVGPYPGV